MTCSGIDNFFSRRYINNTPDGTENIISDRTGFQVLKII